MKLPIYHETNYITDRQGDKLEYIQKNLIPTNEIDRASYQCSNLPQSGLNQALQGLHARTTLGNHFGQCRMCEWFQDIHLRPNIKSTFLQLPREVLPAAARAAGRNISTSLVIVDLKGFGYITLWLLLHLFTDSSYLHRLSQFWQVKSLARDSFQISQDYYPET